MSALTQFKASPRAFYGWYVVAATLGLRRGELLGLRWVDLDFERATITVAQTVQRGQDNPVSAVEVSQRAK